MQELGILGIANAIITNHDARLIALEWSTRLFRAGLHEAAGALFRTAQSAMWAEDRVLAITAGSRKDAKTLRGCWQELARFALEEQLDRVLLSWPKARHPYPILASMAHDTPESEKTISALLGNRLELEVLKIGEQVLEAERPTSIVCMETDLQVWTNKPLARLLNVSLEESRRLNMRDNWLRDGRDDGLEPMKRALTQQSVIDLEYETYLIGSIRCQFRTEFKLILDGRYRLGTLYKADPVVPKVSV